MLSSQGMSTKSVAGIAIRQTIGQQSVIGNYKYANLIAGQGFIQGNKMKTVAAPVVTIKTVVYPNPFIDQINFEFSTTLVGPIKITLFDILGRMVYSAEKNSVDNKVTIDNLYFAQGEYIATLSAKNYTYSTTLIKSK